MGVRRSTYTGYIKDQCANKEICPAQIDLSIKTLLPQPAFPHVISSTLEVETDTDAEALESTIPPPPLFSVSDP